jgi:hypothetical protein
MEEEIQNTERRPKPRCWFTGKVMYKKDHGRRMKYLFNKNKVKGEKTVKKYYPCEHCDHWHLTSMNQSTFNFVQKKAYIQEKSKSMSEKIEERMEYLREKVKFRRTFNKRSNESKQ